MISQLRDTALAWSLIRTARAAAEATRELRHEGEVVLARDEVGDWQPQVSGTPAVDQLFALYLPLCGPAPNGLTIGHLGQSLDGCIATASGDSHFVTGPENIVHLHRLRALADAVIVGAGTVRQDDPRLTTRKVPGDNPVRVVLDPAGRLAGHYRLFQDGAAPTLVVGGAAAPGLAEALVLPSENGLLPLGALKAALEARGLRRLFVEGGGITVSRFLAMGALDVLQITVAPVVLGAGRPGLALPPIASMGEALRPSCRRFSMGADVLFHCDLRSGR